MTLGERTIPMADLQTQHVGANDLVFTKLVPPQLHPQLVPRAALLGRLGIGLSCKLTLVSAPAGFGKTTLVASWLATKAKGIRQKVQDIDDETLLPFTSSPLPFYAAWVALDSGDNDPSRFWRYVLA